jgi:preprotein translocase subunit SecD
MKKIRTKTLSSVLVLVSVISTGQAHAGAKGKDIDVFAASVSSIERLEDGSQPVSFLYDRPIISPSSIELLNSDHETLSIDFKVSKEEAKVMSRFLDKYSDKRMAFVYKGQLLFAPSIKTKLTGEAMRISFKDRAEFKNALETLTRSDEQGDSSP